LGGCRDNGVTGLQQARQLLSRIGSQKINVIAAKRKDTCLPSSEFGDDGAADKSTAANNHGPLRQYRSGIKMFEQQYSLSSWRDRASSEGKARKAGLGRSNGIKHGVGVDNDFSV
jgi:hypothetical protein